jgi:hypothetical protein
MLQQGLLSQFSQQTLRMREKIAPSLLALHLCDQQGR